MTYFLYCVMVKWVRESVEIRNMSVWVFLERYDLQDTVVISKYLVLTDRVIVWVVIYVVSMQIICFSILVCTACREVFRSCSELCFILWDDCNRWKNARERMSSWEAMKWYRGGDEQRWCVEIWGRPIGRGVIYVVGMPIIRFTFLVCIAR